MGLFLHNIKPIVQPLAPYLFGRLLCGPRGCPSRTLYGDFYYSRIFVFVNKTLVRFCTVGFI